MKIFCYMDDNLTEETGASLPTSENERASDTTNKMASPLFIDKRPSIGWTYRFIYRAVAKDEEEIKCKHLLGWSGEHGIELFNSWDMSAEEQNPVTFKEVRDMIRRSQKSQQTNSFG